MKIPDIKIELVHIDGPFKGQIHEYHSPVVTFGRHPDCNVVFPEEMRNISRRHAEICREGNRFLLKDTSSNGTFINGKQNTEVFLKNGDVLILGGMGGPKISFLCTILEPGAHVPDTAASEPPEPQPVFSGPAARVELQPRRDPAPPPPEQRRMFAEMPAAPPESIRNVQKPLVIQHGAALKVFKALPVTLGRGADCDFILNGQAILDHHAQIYFDQGQYWVKDLTGRDQLALNGQVIQTKAPLLPETILSLSPNGPKFHFLGEGRLLEVEASASVQASRQAPLRPKTQPDLPESGHEKKKILLMAGGLLALCIGVAIVVYVTKFDVANAVNELISALPIEKGLQFFNQLFGRQ